jgi:hypothetical protein
MEVATVPCDVSHLTAAPETFRSCVTPEIQQLAFSWCTNLEAEAPVAEAADFLRIEPTPEAGEASYDLAAPMAFPCGRFEIPRPEIAWRPDFEVEERPAPVAEVAELTSVTVFAAPPAAMEFSTSGAATMAGPGCLAVKLAAAEAADCAEVCAAPGYATHWSHADPVEPGLTIVAVPSFRASESAVALGPIEDHAEISVRQRRLMSMPVLASEMTLPHPILIRAFAPAAESLLIDEEIEVSHDEAETYWGELYSEHDPTTEPENLPAPDVENAPEIAPALMLDSTPVDHPAALAACSSEMMPPGLEISSPTCGGGSQFSNAADIQPGLAAEFVPNAPQGEAVNASAEPHTHEPLRPSFGSTVRIKNWRLRITFAKPA